MKGRLVTVPGVGQLHVKLVDSSRFWNQKLATRSVFVEIWETEVGDSSRLGPAECQKSLTVLGFWKSGNQKRVTSPCSRDPGIRLQ